ncbi:MAG: hypothetical protein QXV73_04475 [Candidatus Micrarchaeia archaeon]
MRAIEILSKFWAEKKVEIVFYEGPPKTDGRTIYLPEKYNNIISPVLITTLLHETQHISLNTKNLFERIVNEINIPEEIKREIFNVVEDVRLDRFIMRKYPKVKNLFQITINEIASAEPVSILAGLLAEAMIKAEGLEIPKESLPVELIPLRDEIAEILVSVPLIRKGERLKNSIKEAVEEIYEKVKKFIQEQKQQEKDTATTEEENEKEEDEKQQNNTEPQEEDEKQQNDIEPQEENDQEDENEKEQQNDTETPQDTEINEEKSETEESEIEEVVEELKEAISSLPSLGIEKLEEYMENLSPKEVKVQPWILRRILQKKLESKAGLEKLNIKKINKIYIDPPSVMKKEEKEEKSITLYLCVDNSISMEDGKKYKRAFEIAYNLTKACMNIPKINLKVIYFNDVAEEINIRKIISSRDYAVPFPKGGTRPEKAIDLVLKDKQPNKKEIIFITDGEWATCSIEYLRKYLPTARGILIIDEIKESKEIKETKKYFQVIERIEDLPYVLLKIL